MLHHNINFETTTDDAEGEARGESVPTDWLTQTTVSEALATFVGELEQIPPAFSAKKVAGERAYAMARRGEDVELKPVFVHVQAAELLSLEGGFARVRFACSRGTYIRALARDLGRKLGVSAHLVALRRTRSGSAFLERALPLDQLTQESLPAALVPMISILESWPRVVVGEREAIDLRLGRAITAPVKAAHPISTRVLVSDRNDHLVALAQADGPRLQPFCVF